ncbi:hypothetical protein QN277_003992 [Acacia crassicarpa]|uniref:DUF547 domain-containing protein n=1 Tax=Acacia crassicarpa TaxID=499986 RepID=A0AAE1MDB3_9FABA|nr:hypothetical protein QN277_003992 [Acacia crassicarpa]
MAVSLSTNHISLVALISGSSQMIMNQNLQLRYAKLMSAILESYATDFRRYIDSTAIDKSKEFQRVGSTQNVLDRNFFYSDFQYVVGGLPYCLNSIKNGILRCNQRPPYSLMETFCSEHKQLEFALVKMNPLIHFGICNGTKSSPKLRFFFNPRSCRRIKACCKRILRRRWRRSKSGQ